MSQASYDITATAEGGWTVMHDGRNEGHYLSKEAAFEAAVAAASLAIREGHQVRVTVPARGDGPLNDPGVIDPRQ
jgi:hypothetical protein